MKKILPRLFLFILKDYFIEREKFISLWVAENKKRLEDVSALSKQVESLQKELNEYKQNKVS